MNTNKILVAGIAGGLTFFLLGWLFYGMLLMDFMTANSSGIAGLHKDPMVMWALIVGNLSWGFLFAVILGCWSGDLTLGKAAARGAIIGLLTAINVDMVMFATTNVTTLTCVAVDVATVTVMGAIGAAVITAVLNWGKKATV
ncbi:MAG: hypothetical protein V4541_12445 [Bacteroidota bacterium]